MGLPPAENGPPQPLGVVYRGWGLLPVHFPSRTSPTARGPARPPVGQLPADGQCPLLGPPQPPEALATEQLRALGSISVIHSSKQRKQDTRVPRDTHPVQRGTVCLEQTET